MIETSVTMMVAMLLVLFLSIWMLVAFFRIYGNTKKIHEELQQTNTLLRQVTHNQVLVIQCLPLPSS